MDLIDRDRGAQGVGARRAPGCGRGSASRSTTIDAVCGRSSAAKATGSDLSGNSVPSGPMISYLYLSPGRRRRHEDFPKAVAAHPHGVAPPVPGIEVADHADASCIGGEHHEGDAGDAVEHQRMRAELVIEAHMRALAEQIEIEIGQHRRKSVGILDLDHVLAVTRAHVIARRAVGQGTGEQPGLMDAAKTAGAAARRRSPRHRRRRAETRAPPRPSSSACRPR